MKFRVRDLFCWEGSIVRSHYFLLGVLLFLLKQFVDRTIANNFFGRSWTFVNYLIPSPAFGILALPPEDQRFYATMVFAALPFIGLGVLLTVKRLRAVSLPRWLVLLFFAPAPVNLIFFLVITLLPGPEDARSAGADEPEWKPDPLDEVGSKGDPGACGYAGRLLPENRPLNILVSVLLPIPFGIGLGFLSIHWFQNYGWGVFVGLPFAMPMISVLIHGLRRPRSLAECVRVGFLSLLAMIVVLLAFAFEGLVCVIMALPLACPLVLLGTHIGYLIQRRPMPPRKAAQLFAALLVFLPSMIGAEAIVPRPRPLFAVTSSVEVDAPPERVWKHVIEFSDLPAPDDWLFRTGIAYPIRAEIDGRGPGAIRRCVFSTGAFVEPIEVWDEPRLLRFAVTSNPPPMKEWSPFADIHPPHLENYLVSRRGQFLLEPLPGGRTRLEGTTWYHHTMWPAAYWRVWSDQIIGRIHLQVLKHVKHLAETSRGERLRVVRGHDPDGARSR